MDDDDFGSEMGSGACPGSARPRQRRNVGAVHAGWVGGGCGCLWSSTDRAMGHTRGGMKATCWTGGGARRWAWRGVWRGGP